MKNKVLRQIREHGLTKKEKDTINDLLPVIAKDSNFKSSTDYIKGELLIKQLIRKAKAEKLLEGDDNLVDVWHDKHGVPQAKINEAVKFLNEMDGLILRTIRAIEKSDDVKVDNLPSTAADIFDIEE